MSQKKDQDKDKFSNELTYNQGDADLHKYFEPLVSSIKANLIDLDDHTLRKALRQGIIKVAGVRLYSALMSDDWKLREAAVKAFLEFIQDELVTIKFIFLVN